MIVLNLLNIFKISQDIGVYEKISEIQLIPTPTNISYCKNFIDQKYSYFQEYHCLLKFSNHVLSTNCLASALFHHILLR